jgi:hypothetical protein
MLVCLDRGFNKLGYHQLARYAQARETSRPGVGTSAGIHPDHNERHLGDKGQESSPRGALPQDDGAGVVYAHDVENLFSNVNPENANACHRIYFL